MQYLSVQTRSSFSVSRLSSCVNFSFLFFFLLFRLSDDARQPAVVSPSNPRHLKIIEDVTNSGVLDCYPTFIRSGRFFRSFSFSSVSCLLSSDTSSISFSFSSVFVLFLALSS
jgi:hypothetical protein